jgi:hypothetical protein
MTIKIHNNNQLSNNENCHHLTNIKKVNKISNIKETITNYVPEKYVYVICISSDVKTNPNIKQKIMNNYAISNNCIDNMNFNIGNVGLLYSKQRTVYYTVTQSKHK